MICAEAMPATELDSTAATRRQRKVFTSKIHEGHGAP